MVKPYRKHGGDVNHPDFPHFEFAGYRAGCRCNGCVEANKTYRRNQIRSIRATNSDYLERDRLGKVKYRKTSDGKAAYKHSDAKRRTKEVCTGNSELIRLIYKCCPEGYVVDHIIPLSRGGLHHEDNMQYLPIRINLRKGAKLDFDCSDHALSWKEYIS